MTARQLQQLLCRLGRRIAPAEMGEWAVAMTREIDEIDNPRAALQWAAACLMSCASQRLRALLRIAAAAARFALGGYCLVVAGQVALDLPGLAAGGEAPTWKFGSWLLIALLFAATAPLVALRRPAAAWTLCAATTVVAATFHLGVNSAPSDAVSQERMAAYIMVGAMLSLTGAAFWLTRPPDADLTI
jgi:hypothetical protein